MNFIDKKVSVKKAIAILAKNNINVDDDEAAVILDFLYLLAKNTEEKRHRNLREKSNFKKTL
ncbi:MAG: hypothetical protein QM763_19365 [Agriterribacter sp.]